MGTRQCYASQTIHFLPTHSLHLGEALGDGLDADRRGDEVEEDDLVLGHAVLEEDLDGLEARAAGGKHGVEEEDEAAGNVLGDLCVLLGELVSARSHVVH